MNMFNPKKPSCYNCSVGSKIYTGDHSYVYTVKWHDFIQNINSYIDIALKINANIENYNITKQIINKQGAFSG